MSVDWEAVAAELTADLAKATAMIREQHRVVRQATEAVQDSRSVLAEVSSRREREQSVDELVNSLVSQGFLVVDWNGNCYARTVEPTDGEHQLRLVRGIVRSTKPRVADREAPGEESDDDAHDEPTC